MKKDKNTALYIVLGLAGAYLVYRFLGREKRSSLLEELGSRTTQKDRIDSGDELEPDEGMSEGMMQNLPAQMVAYGML